MKDQSQEPLLIKDPKWWEYVLYNTKVQIVLVLILCAFIGIGTPLIWQQIWKLRTERCSVETDLRFSCLPHRPTALQNRSECVLTKNCCWDKDADNDQIKCYYAVSVNETTKLPGYKIERSFSNLSSISLGLFVNSDSLPAYVDNTRNNSIKSPKVIERLSLSLQHFSEQHFSLKIAPTESISSTDYLTEYLDYNWNDLMPISNESFQSSAVIDWPKNLGNDFRISIKRRDTNALIFNVGSHSPFIYSDSYIEMTTLLPNDYLYGLGQSPSKAFKHNFTFPQDWQIFDKQQMNLTYNQTNWFSSHPFYIVLDGNNGNAFGVLLLNSHPIQVSTNSIPSLTFRTVGGELNFHFFMGPKPHNVIEQLYSLIKKPSLPPYWALGFHLCRAVCDHDFSPNALNKLLDKLLQNSVPVESDCGNAYATKYAANSDTSLEKYHEIVSNHSMRTTMVHVPHIFKDFADNHVSEWHALFLKNSANTESYEGQVSWLLQTDMSKTPPICRNVTNHTVYYPNYYDLKSKAYLEVELSAELKRIDGFLLSSNTPLDMSNKTCISDRYQWNKNYYEDLNEFTPCLETSFGVNMSHLAVHNIYGYMHSRRVKEAISISSSKTRKLVISLSTFTGNGQFGGYWGGNLPANWDMLKQTVIQMLDFSLSGIPLTGFPVCGFTGNASDGELCVRWYQLASLQPLMISHRDYKQNLTDPVSLSEQYNDKLAFGSMKNALTIRYRLLPYFYTQFYKSAKSSEMVIKPLFFEFPEDRRTYRLDGQYLWGSGLMVSPVTEFGTKSVESYFPAGVWYDYYSGRRVVNSTKEGSYHDLSAVEDHVNLHLRGGFIIPTQTPGRNTKESRSNNFTLITALNTSNEAEGDLFIDDGISEDTLADKYLLSHFYADMNSFTINLTVSNDWVTNVLPIHSAEISTIVDTINIFGLIRKPINGINQTSTITKDQIHIEDKDLNFNSLLGVLSIKNLHLDLKLGNYTLKWSFKDWDNI